MLSELNKNTFGLDFSDRSLRLAQLKKIGKKLVLSSYNEAAVPKDIIIDGEIQQEEKLIKLIDQLIKSANGRRVTTKNVVSVLPEPKTFVKVIKIFNDSTDNLDKLIQEEAKNHIPLSSEEMYLDWQILEKNSKEIKVLVGASPKKISDSYTSVLEKSGLIPNILEIEAAAISRSLIAENDAKAKIIIDFGAIRSGLIVFDKKTIQFTVSLPISGIKITETISQTLNLDWEKAEQAKIVCGLDKTKCEGALLKILMPNITSLANQISKSILFYQSNFSDGNQISEIILCGGGANFSKIDTVLSEKINLPVKIGNPFANAFQTKKIAIPANKILSYTTAIGLALRVFQKSK